MPMRRKYAAGYALQAASSLAAPPPAAAARTEPLISRAHWDRHRAGASAGSGALTPLSAVAILWPEWLQAQARERELVKFLSTRVLRNRPGYVRELAREDDLVLTSNGKPVAILVGVEDRDFEEAA